jgi:lipid A 3-O-deacylase
MNKKSLFAGLIALLCISAPAQAVDSWSGEIGGGESVNVWRVGAQWKWQRKWLQSSDWHLGGYWDAQLGQWDGNGGDNITDISLTPTFRYQRNSGQGLYVEGAIGFHLLSGKQITGTKRFGGSFQFGDHIGVGYRFGERGKYDLSARLQHHSDLGINKPNPGINFFLIRLQYHLD